MKSFQNRPGSCSSSAGGARSTRSSSKPSSASLPFQDASAANTTRCPRRRSTSPIPMQLFVGPYALSGMNRIVDMSTPLWWNPRSQAREVDMAGATGVIPSGTTEAILRTFPDRVPPPFTARILAPLPPIPPGERPIVVDQTNHSVVAGETVIVKWFARPVAGPQPVLDLLAHLSAVGFTRTARPSAALFRDGAPTAVVTAYLPDAVDGWEWCVDEAVAGRTSFAEELGLLAAELHRAMATPSEVFPDPVRVTGCDPSEWRARARRALDEALAVTPDEP